MVLRHGWRGDQVGYAITSSSFLQLDAGRCRVGHDVASDRLDRRSKRHCAVESRLDDLVGHQDGHTVLVRQTLKSFEEFTEIVLPGCQLPTADVLGSEQGRGTIADDQREPALAEQRPGLSQELLLVFGVVRPGESDVVQHGLWIHLEPLRDVHQSIGPERSLGVDVKAFALATAMRDRNLARDGECMAQLCLSASELAVNLGDAARLKAATEDTVEGRRAGGEADERAAGGENRVCSGESRRDQLSGRVLDLRHFRVRDTLDVRELAPAGICDGLDGVESRLLELFDVRGTDTKILYNAKARKTR